MLFLYQRKGPVSEETGPEGGWPMATAKGTIALKEDVPVVQAPFSRTSGIEVVGTHCIYEPAYRDSLFVTEILNLAVGFTTN